MKTRTRILSVVMTVALLLSSLIIVIPTSAVTVDTASDAYKTALTNAGCLNASGKPVSTKTWTQVIDALVKANLISADINEALEGSGTSADPYKINNEYDLAYMAYYFNAHPGGYNTAASQAGFEFRYAHYEVTANINASTYQWVPIGNSYADKNGPAFRGTFQGGGFQITNDSTNTTNQKGSGTYAYGGLFGACRTGAKIYNVNLVTKMIPHIQTQNHFIGGLTGVAFGTTIENCHVDIFMDNTIRNATQHIGGITGYTNEKTTITACSVTGRVYLKNGSNNQPIAFGGIVGRLNGGGTTISGCVANVDVRVDSANSGMHLADIVAVVNASNDCSFNITNCVGTSSFIVGAVTVDGEAGTAVAPLRIGSAVGFVSSGTGLKINIDGFVDASSMYGRGADNTTVDFGRDRNIIGVVATTGNTITLKNCWSTNTNIREDIYACVATTVVAKKADGTTAKTYSVAAGTHQYVPESVSQLTFTKTVDGANTKISVPENLASILKACGTLSVGIGATRTATSVTNASEKTLEYTVKATSGAVNYLITPVIKNAAGTAASLGRTAGIWDNWIYYAKAPEKDESGVYLVYTAEELAYISLAYKFIYGTDTQPDAYSVKLMDNINLANREWTPIGHYTYFTSLVNHRYKGNFNGNGKEIQNMTITGSVRPNMAAALFGANMAGSTIHDFTMTNANITRTVSVNGGNQGTAAVVAFGSGTAILQNITVTATINVTTTSAEPYVGGILANSNNQKLYGIVMNGSVTVTGNKVIPCAGGIVGKNAGTLEIKGAVNNANVTVKATGGSATSGWNSIAGGFLACNAAANQAITLNGCVNNGNITAQGYINNWRLGGLVGNVGRGGSATTWTINGFSNTGKISHTTSLTKGAGGSSGKGTVIGQAEAGTITLANVYAPYYLTTLNNFGNISGGVSINGATGVSSANNVSTYDNYFEYDVVNNGDGTVSIRASKVAFDAYTATASNKMIVKYGSKVIFDLSKSGLNVKNAVDGYYEWTTPYVEGAKVTFENSINGYELPTPESATWAGMYRANAFAGGDGATLPYVIETPEQLGYLAYLVNNATTNASYKGLTYHITKDIDLSAHRWMPIGNVHDGNYAVTFDLVGVQADGKNPTIKGMNMTDGYYNYGMSFIGYANGSFSLTNLNFDGTTVGYDAVLNESSAIPAYGTLVGGFYGGVIQNVHVTNFDLYYDSPAVGHYISAVVGYLGAQSVKLLDCTADGKIVIENAHDSRIGGFVGRARYGTVQNCVNNVDITVTMAKDAKISRAGVGGIIGAAIGDARANTTNVTNCVNNGKIVLNANGKIDYATAAGMVGYQHPTNSSQTATTVIDGCINVGIIQVNKGDGFVGTTEACGILGSNSGVNSVKNSKSFTTDVIAGTVIQNTTNDANAGTDSDGNPNPKEETLAVKDNFNVNLNLTTEIKAELRIDRESAANSGLRFNSFFTASALEAITNAGYQVEFGTIIAPTMFFDACGVDKLLDLEIPVVVPYEVEKYAAAGNGVNGYTKVDGVNNYFNGAIVGILSQNFDLDFTAVAYMTITINGVAYTVYADYNGEADRARSVLDIAQDAINDRSDVMTEDYGCYIGDGNENGEYSRYSKKQIAAIQAYIDSYAQSVNAQ